MNTWEGCEFFFGQVIWSNYLISRLFVTFFFCFSKIFSGKLHFISSIFTVMNVFTVIFLMVYFRTKMAMFGLASFLWKIMIMLLILFRVISYDMLLFFLKWMVIFFVLIIVFETCNYCRGYTLFLLFNVHCRRHSSNWKYFTIYFNLGNTTCYQVIIPWMKVLWNFDELWAYKIFVLILYQIPV